MRITICGSMQFLPEIGQLKLRLEERGHIVVIPIATPDEKVVDGVYVKPWQSDDGVTKELPQNDELWRVKFDSMVSYFEEIEQAEAIIVANYEKNGIAGYIGGNTLMEIGVALSRKKPLFMMYPPNVSELSYGEELMGSLPVVLNGNIDKFEKYFMLYSSKAHGG